MKFSEVAPLLDVAPLPLEMGYERLEDGVLHVACRTDMRGCTGEMFEWWFRSRPDTQKYIWWHPLDHIGSHWAEGEEGTHVGSIHLAEEYFTGLPAEQLAIQFQDAATFFDPDDYKRARADGAVSAAICANVGMSFTPPRDESGKVRGGRLLHIGRDTAWGLVLRSHFYMGQDLPSLGKSRDEIIEAVPDEFGRALLMHCYNEFVFLSKFLPSLYIGEHRDERPVILPW
ncbi:DAPG hydrolase family protein [Pseudomonas japonica]|nr:hypothetical protein [Pseudomonas japonica]